jgi:hypothetical protein
MDTPFLTFKKFKIPEESVALTEFLTGQYIDFQIDEAAAPLSRPAFGISNKKEVRVKIQAADFERVDELLADSIRQQIDGIEKDYYLLDFTDEELIEIVVKPDEWSLADYQLAQIIRKQRLKELAKPETGQFG